MKDLEDVEAHVEPDQIGECQRPHRVRHAELHHRVDCLAVGHALHQAVDRLVDHRHQDSVGDETRVIVHLDRHLAQSPGQLHHGIHSLVAGALAADHLHQLHHRHGIHEVHADHTLGPVRAGTEPGEFAFRPQEKVDGIR